MLEEEMVASYEVQITGIQRTKTEMKRLDDAIRSLRAGAYSSTAKVTGAGNVKGFNKDIFTEKIDALEGRVQTAAQNAMIKCMDIGKDVQAKSLRQSITDYGTERFKSGRGGSAGRDDTGAMIKALARNVEVSKGPNETLITGWHGWREDHPYYFEVQERGSHGGGGASGGLGSLGRKKTRGEGKSGGVPAANSLGAAIPLVRETLKSELGKLR